MAKKQVRGFPEGKVKHPTRPSKLPNARPVVKVQAVRFEEELGKRAIDEADEIIYGDREKTYGHPTKNIGAIATAWRTYLNSKNQTLSVQLDERDVCQMMIMLKIMRDANSPKRDNIVDEIGYAALVDRIGENPF